MIDPRTATAITSRLCVPLEECSSVNGEHAQQDEEGDTKNTAAKGE